MRRLLARVDVVDLAASGDGLRDKLEAEREGNDEHGENESLFPPQTG